MVPFYILAGDICGILLEHQSPLSGAILSNKHSHVKPARTNAHQFQHLSFFFKIVQECTLWGFFRHPLQLNPVRIPAGKRLRPFFSKMGCVRRCRGCRKRPSCEIKKNVVPPFHNILKKPC